MLGWAWLMQPSLSHFCSGKRPLTLLPINSPSKTHWFPKLDLSSILTLICCWFSIWGEQTFFMSPQEPCHTTLLPKMSRHAEAEWHCWLVAFSYGHLSALHHSQNGSSCEVQETWPRNLRYLNPLRTTSQGERERTEDPDTIAQRVYPFNSHEDREPSSKQIPWPTVPSWEEVNLLFALELRIAVELWLTLPHLLMLCLHGREGFSGLPGSAFSSPHSLSSPGTEQSDTQRIFSCCSRLSLSIQKIIPFCSTESTSKADTRSPGFCFAPCQGGRTKSTRDEQLQQVQCLPRLAFPNRPPTEVLISDVLQLFFLKEIL